MSFNRRYLYLPNLRCYVFVILKGDRLMRLRHTKNIRKFYYIFITRECSSDLGLNNETVFFSRCAFYEIRFVRLRNLSWNWARTDRFIKIQKFQLNTLSAWYRQMFHKLLILFYYYLYFHIMFTSLISQNSHRWSSHTRKYSKFIILLVIQILYCVSWWVVFILLNSLATKNENNLLHLFRCPYYSHSSSSISEGIKEEKYCNCEGE